MKISFFLRKYLHRLAYKLVLFYTISSYKRMSIYISGIAHKRCILYYKFASHFTVYNL